MKTHINWLIKEAKTENEEFEEESDNSVISSSEQSSEESYHIDSEDESSPKKNDIVMNRRLSCFPKVKMISAPLKFERTNTRFSIPK